MACSLQQTPSHPQVALVNYIIGAWPKPAKGSLQEKALNVALDQLYFQIAVQWGGEVKGFESATSLKDVPALEKVQRAFVYAIGATSCQMNVTFDTKPAEDLRSYAAHGELVFFWGWTIKVRHSPQLHLWSVLEKEIHVPMPKGLENMSETEIADTFKAWMEKNKEALESLTSLVIRNGKYSQLAPEIGLLPNLKELDVALNQLESLPDSICNLQQLETLNASSNFIESLPSSLGILSKLKVLNLYGNPLKDFPCSILYLKELHFITDRSVMLDYLESQIYQLSYDDTI